MLNGSLEQDKLFSSGDQALVLTVLIIALVYGLDRRCAAVSGSFLSILLICVMGGAFRNL